MPLLRPIACAAAALLLPAAARGASCSVATAGIAFGAYDALAGAPISAAGSIALACNGNATAQVAVSAGASGSFGARAMSGGGADRLLYNLYRDAALTSVWGDGTGGSAIATTGPGYLPVYGRIPARQDVTAGDYADTLVVTVNW